MNQVCARKNGTEETCIRLGTWVNIKLFTRFSFVFYKGKKRDGLVAGRGSEINNLVMSRKGNRVCAGQ